MSIKSKLQRLDFINALQRVYNSILARQQLQSTQLISVVFEDRYNMSNPADMGVLMSNLEYKIDNELKKDLYDYITTGIQGLVGIGVSHSVANSINIMGDSAFDFLKLGDRIALNYINRVSQDGLRLSDRIWDSQQKDAINRVIFETIRTGGTQYDLAKKIEEVVGSGVPSYRIKGIAETELTYAYSHAKADILLEEVKLFKNAQAYIKISLSPAHPKPDICDLMAGTYKAEEAPLPPFHTHCFTGDTLVVGADISTKFVSRYNGSVVTITTAKGSRFTVTPNHPMLGIDGFASANSFKKGDYLVATGDRFESLIRIKPNRKTIKALIKDIIIPDSMVLGAVPSTVDFHGDGASYENIDIISSSSKLLGSFKPSFMKLFSNLDFIRRLGEFVKLVVFSPFYKFTLRSFLATNGIMGFLSAFLSKFRIKFVNRLLSFAMTSYFNSISQEDFPNKVTANFKFLTKGKLRDTSVIFADKIVDISFTHFKGNVYNLETVGHWYTAESIIAHNCLCETETILRPMSDSLETTTLDERIKSNPDLVTVNSVETHDKTIPLH